MSARTQRNVFDAWLDASERNRGTERFRVSLAAFRAIADGRSPGPDELAGDTDLPRDVVARTVVALAREGRILRDDAGRITGAGGLSLVGSRHGLRMFGRRYWVWCALDAVGIPAGLGADARVDSVCEDTGEPAAIDIRAGRPEASWPSPLWVSLVAPALDQPLYDGCCSKIRFYADPARVPGEATAVEVAETAALGGRLWRDSIPL